MLIRICGRLTRRRIAGTGFDNASLQDLSTFPPAPTSALGITGVMQTLGRRYVRYINHSYRRSGTLWEGRYHAGLGQGHRYLLTCYR